MHDHLDANRQNAIAFYRTAYSGDPARAVDMYTGADNLNEQAGNRSGSIYAALQSHAEPDVRLEESTRRFVIAAQPGSRVCEE